MARLRRSKALLALALLIAGCCRTSDPLVVHDPCGTFVSEFAPRRTPRLHRESGHLLLEVSFTPAKNEEAATIMKAIKASPTKLKIEKTGRVIVAERYGKGSMLIHVASREEAMTVLTELCFTDGSIFGREEE